MRDPLGYVLTDGDVVVRHLYKRLPEAHFLNSLDAERLVDAGLLTPFSVRSEYLIESRKLEFVSYPYEWTHSQLLEAAKCTLNVMFAALAVGNELKDATAFNVLFNGTNAEFCDHLSFQQIETPYCWAYAQFLRHFVFPLACSKLLGTSVASTFKNSLDGLGQDTASHMLRWHRFQHRVAFAFLTNEKSILKSEDRLSKSSGHKISKHLGVYKFLQWQLDGLSRQIAVGSQWGDYETERNHYEEISMADKKFYIEKWLTKLGPKKVLDLGCNQGEFSLIAAKHSAEVIAIDADEAAIEKLRHRIGAERVQIQTVLTSIDDLSPPRGWGGTEFPSLLSRLECRADLVMALALTHHLVIGCGIGLQKVAELLSQLTNRFLIVELIPGDDEKVRQIGMSRNRIDTQTVFSLNQQYKALADRFTLVEQHQIQNSSRVLVLMEKIK